MDKRYTRSNKEYISFIEPELIAYYVKAANFWGHSVYYMKQYLLKHNNYSPGHNTITFNWF